MGVKTYRYSLYTYIPVHEFFTVITVVEDIIMARGNLVAILLRTINLIDLYFEYNY